VRSAARGARRIAFAAAQDAGVKIVRRALEPLRQIVVSEGRARMSWRIVSGSRAFGCNRAIRRRRAMSIIDPTKVTRSTKNAASIAASSTTDCIIVEAGGRVPAAEVTGSNRASIRRAPRATRRRPGCGARAVGAASAHCQRRNRARRAPHLRQRASSWLVRTRYDLQQCGRGA
jgi:hypothetical protein